MGQVVFWALGVGKPKDSGLCGAEVLVEETNNPAHRISK